MSFLSVVSKLKQIDKDMRAKSICPSCGKPKKGFAFVTKVKGHGTGRSGEREYSGPAQTPEQAGLCTCSTIKPESEAKR